MQTISVTNFKAHALQLLNQVATDSQEIILTKRGKPVAKVIPIEPEDNSIQFGKLKGSVIFNEEIVTPLGEDDWESC